MHKSAEKSEKSNFVL